MYIYIHIYIYIYMYICIYIYIYVYMHSRKRTHPHTPVRKHSAWATDVKGAHIYKESNSMAAHVFFINLVRSPCQVNTMKQ